MIIASKGDSHLKGVDFDNRLVRKTHTEDPTTSAKSIQEKRNMRMRMKQQSTVLQFKRRYEQMEVVEVYHTDFFFSCSKSDVSITKSSNQTSARVLREKILVQRQ